MEFITENYLGIYLWFMCIASIIGYLILYEEKKLRAFKAWGYMILGVALWPGVALILIYVIVRMGISLKFKKE